MLKYCLIGDPLNFSLSPQIQRAFASQFDINLEYELHPVPAMQMQDFILNFFAQGGEGMNITMPHKQAACEYIAEQDLSAKTSGACNTLYKHAGKICAANTDGIGLKKDLMQHAINLAGQSVLILGAGGAVRGIVAELLNCKVKKIYIANRTRQNAERVLAHYMHPKIIFKSLLELNTLHADLIINALSADIPQIPNIYAEINAKNTICYDLNYHSNSLFLNTMKTQGASITLNGLGMLVEQAAAAFYLWHKVQPQTGAVLKELQHGLI